MCATFFFGKGSYIKAVGARVSWRDICLPKFEGGLGMKSSSHIAAGSSLACFRRVSLGCLGLELCFKGEFFLVS